MDERTNGIHPLRVRIPAFQPRNNNNDDEDSNNNNTDKADEDINNGNNNNSRNNEKFFAMWRQLENFTDIFFNRQKKSATRKTGGGRFKAATIAADILSFNGACSIKLSTSEMNRGQAWKPFVSSPRISLSFTF